MFVIQDCVGPSVLTFITCLLDPWTFDDLYLQQFMYRFHIFYADVNSLKRF